VRYLRFPSLFHLRIGWLDVLTRIVGVGQKSLAQCAPELEQQARHFSQWADIAGLTAKPQGGPMRSHMQDLLRMIVAYGLYDEDRNSLTDAGQVLLHTEPDLNTPFRWVGARRWAGLWIVVRANGDVILTMLRKWPSTTLGGNELDDFIISTLEDLAKKTRDPQESNELLEQIRRLTETMKGRRNIVFPHLEPLRELGYLERLEGISGYGLTDSGVRLVEGLKQNIYASRDADALLRNGLSRCFLVGEGVSDPQPAGYQDLRTGVDDSPESLAVVSGEVPLTPFIAWLQGRLVGGRVKKWIDDKLARAIVQHPNNDGSGHFEIKRDEEVHGVNLVWRPADSVNTKSSSGVLAVEDSTSIPTEPTISASNTTPNQPTNNDDFWSHPEQISALIWLEYVQSRSEVLDLADEDVLRRGGVMTRLAQLNALLRLPSQHLINKRRKVQDVFPSTVPPATKCLHRFITATPKGPIIRGLDVLLDEWSNYERFPAGYMLARASATSLNYEQIRAEANQQIRDFLSLTLKIPYVGQEILDFCQRWDGVREWTRSLLGDNFCSGAWTQEAVRERLAWHIEASRSPHVAAVGMLDELLADRRHYEYWQNRDVSSEWINAAHSTDVFGDSGTPGVVSLQELGEGYSVRLDITGIRAATRKHARVLGSLQCEEAIARVAWKSFTKVTPLLTKEDAQCEEDVPPGNLPPNHPEPSVRLGWRRLLENPASKERFDGYGSEGMPAALTNAFRGLVLVEAAERRASERLLTTWTILEDLGKAGDDLPSHEVIGRLARASAIIIFRQRFIQIRNDALSALIARCYLDPESPNLESQISYWLPERLTALVELRSLNATIRRARLAANVEVPIASPKDAISQLWNACHKDGAKLSNCEALQQIITSSSPLTARRLAYLYGSILKLGPDNTLHDSAGFSNEFITLMEDARSFFSEVYDARNRIVHQGELARLHNKDVPIEMEALIAPLLPLVEQILEEVRSLTPLHHGGLSQVWSALDVRAVDLGDKAKTKKASLATVVSLLGL